MTSDRHYMRTDRETSDTPLRTCYGCPEAFGNKRDGGCGILTIYLSPCFVRELAEKHIAENLREILGVVA